MSINKYMGIKHTPFYIWCRATSIDGTVAKGEIKEAVVSAQSVVHWVSTSSTTKDVYLLGDTETREDTEVANFLQVLSIFSFKQEMR